MIDILLAVLIGIWVIVGIRYLVKEWKYKHMLHLAQRTCWLCKHYHTNSCPNSSKCYDTIDRPYFELVEEDDK